MKTENILKDDVSKNCLQSFSSTTAFALTQRIGMWGADMFGSFTTLGAGYSVSYNNGERNTVIAVDKTLNVIQIES